MKFWRSILPSTTPPHLIGKSNKDISDEHILQSISLSAILLLLFAIVLDLTGIFSVFGTQGVIGGFLLLGAMLPLTFIRRTPYLWRVAPLLFFFLGSGVANFLISGISAIGISFFFTFVILVGALLGKKAHQISLGVVILTFAALAWLMGDGILLQFPLQQPDPRSLLSWSEAFVHFILLLALISVTLGILINGLENSLSVQLSLAAALEQEKGNLESQLQERTKDLQKRAEGVRLIAEISRNITSILDQEILFQRVVDLLQERLGLYYVGLFIVEGTGQFAILKAGTGEAGRQMVTNGHRLQVGGSSMIGWATSTRLPKIALDVGEEAVRFNNPLLPDTHSELALPIFNREIAIGALTIQSSKENAFDADDIRILEGIADSLAIALENARLFQQNQQDLNEIRMLNQQFLQQSWGSSIQDADSLHSEFENPLQTHRSKKGYEQTIPITFRNQQIGKITLETVEPTLSPEDQQFIDTISAQTMLSLESARLLRESQRQALQEEKINQITAQFSSAFDIEGVLQTALKELSQLPSVSEISVHLVPSEKLSGKNNNGHEVQA